MICDKLDELAVRSVVLIELDNRRLLRQIFKPVISQCTYFTKTCMSWPQPALCVNWRYFGFNSRIYPDLERMSMEDVETHSIGSTAANEDFYVYYDRLNEFIERATWTAGTQIAEMFSCQHEHANYSAFQVRLLSCLTSSHKDYRLLTSMMSIQIARSTQMSMMTCSLCIYASSSTCIVVTMTTLLLLSLPYVASNTQHWPKIGLL